MVSKLMKPMMILQEGGSMPLWKGKKAATRGGIAHNIKVEMKAGRPQKQAIAIALDEARRGGAELPKPKQKK